MTTRVLAQSLYGLVAVTFLVSGVSVLLLGTGLLPEAIRNIVLGFGHGDLNTLHIMQELSSLLVFAGLITLWFMRHYRQSQGFHWAMTAFWAIFALIHWFNISGLEPSAVGPLINTIPVALFAIVGLLRLRSEMNWSP